MILTVSEQIHDYFAAPETAERFQTTLSRLIRHRSVTGEAAPGAPFGTALASCLEEALQIGREAGFSVRNYDGYVGLIDLNDKPVSLHILGHLDVVGEGEGWHTDPYVLAEKDGTLYGRGVADDKGPAVAALFALEALSDLHLPLSGNVRLILGTDEESGSGDLAYYFAREPYAPHTFTPDADFPLIHIEKGQYRPCFGKKWTRETGERRLLSLTGGFRKNVVPPRAEAHIAGFTAREAEPYIQAVSEKTSVSFNIREENGGIAVTANGKNAHAATPEVGVNAVTALLTLVAALPLTPGASRDAVCALSSLFPHGDFAGRALGIARSDKESGDLTLSLNMITINEDGFSALFDARTPVTSDEKNCKEVCEKALAAHGFSVTEDGEMTPPHVTDANSTFVRTLLSAYESVTGQTDARPIAIGGGTYVHDIPGGVAFGCNFPGYDCRMHGADERSTLADLLKSAEIFTLAVYNLLGKGET